MERSRSISEAAYIQAVASSHVATARLVEEIHRFDEKKIAPLLETTALTSLLNRSFEDLFVPCIENGRYIALEKALLRETIKTNIDQVQYKPVSLQLNINHLFLTINGDFVIDFIDIECIGRAKKEYCRDAYKRPKAQSTIIQIIIQDIFASESIE